MRTVYLLNTSKGRALCVDTSVRHLPMYRKTVVAVLVSGEAAIIGFNHLRDNEREIQVDNCVHERMWALAHALYHQHEAHKLLNWHSNGR